MHPEPSRGEDAGDWLGIAISFASLLCDEEAELLPDEGRDCCRPHPTTHFPAREALLNAVSARARGQADGVFRSDVSALWLIAVVGAIVHVSSTELQAGGLTEADVERTMVTTAFGAIS
jgi:hypothetical protein